MARNRLNGKRRFSTITRKPPKKLAVIDRPFAIYPTRWPAEIGDSIEYRMKLNLVALADKVAELNLDEDVTSDIDQLLSIASDMRC